GLDLLLKAAQAAPTTPTKETQKKSKAPSMVLVGSYDTPVIVGRGSQATLNLGRINKQVSRRHAIIEWCTVALDFQITVLGQNGVKINGVGYPSGQQRTLKEGDIVDLVGVRMLFRKPIETPPHSQESHHSDTESLPIGLVTPTRSPKKHIQLATPQFTPTPSMRHKTMNYDLTPASRPIFDSPSSDAGTEFGTSPMQSRPVYSLPAGVSPVKRPIGLETPKSEADYSVKDNFPNSPSKSAAQRQPLAPLSLANNGKHGSSPAPKAKAANVLKPLSSKSENIEAGTNKPIASTPTKKPQQHQSKSVTSSGDSENIMPAVPKKDKPKAIKDSQDLPTNIKAKSEKAKPLAAVNKDEKADAHPSKLENKDTKNPLLTSSSTMAEKDKSIKLTKEVSKDDRDDDNSSSSSESVDEPAKKPAIDYTESIIDTLVFARKKKSMTLSELYDEMIASKPSLVDSQTTEEIKEQMLHCLSSARCVGKITRRGKDAYNKPLESQWYYIPECDHNVMRKLTRQEVMPSARKCTLKDKQYFFKMPPKLPYHRKSASPYAVKQAVRRTKELSRFSGDIDETEGSSSDPDESTSESVLPTKKRKSAIKGHVEKKRKGAASPDKPEQKEGNTEDNEEDEVQNDSLDDVSELSGLSD
ncbi:hypothetical protein BGZ76_009489, partial [Entomortierella beljakovae]